MDEEGGEGAMPAVVVEEDPEILVGEDVRY